MQFRVKFKNDKYQLMHGMHRAEKLLQKSIFFVYEIICLRILFITLKCVYHYQLRRNKTFINFVKKIDDNNNKNN